MIGHTVRGWKRAAAVLAAFAGLGACAGPDVLQASFDHSEWHSPAMLRLDVASGGFQAWFRDGTLATGRFSAHERVEIASALVAARRAGFGGACPPNTIVISNGGARTLDYEGHGQHLTALDDPSACWTDEATHLHDLINRFLEQRGDDWTMPLTRMHLGKLG